MELTQHSTGGSLGNLVDGLPGALHTEAFWKRQGVFQPAPIITFYQINIVKTWNVDLISKRFVQAEECMRMRIMAVVILKIINKLVI